MLSPITTRASHSFIKRSFIRSLCHPNAIGHVKVSHSELRAVYALTMLSAGRIQCVLMKQLQLIYLVFLHFGLERNGDHFSDVMEKKAHLVIWSTVTRGGHLPCARPYAGVFHTTIL